MKVLICLLALLLLALHSGNASGETEPFAEAIKRVPQAEAGRINPMLRAAQGGGDITQDALCIGFLARTSGLIQEAWAAAKQNPPQMVQIMTELSTLLLADVSMRLDESNLELFSSALNNGQAVAEPSSGDAVEVAGALADSSHWRHALAVACAARAE